MHFILAADDNGGAGGMIASCIFVLIEFGLIGLMLAGVWKVFAKAGEPGWAAIVPIYNCVILLKIADKPIWWIILMLIPCVSIIVGIVVLHSIAKAFGQGVGFTLGLLFLPFIFWPILGFGSARYGG